MMILITKLAVYEPPFIVDDTRPPLNAKYEARLADLLSADRRGDAVGWFLTVAVGVPAEMVAQMRKGPMWPGMERLASTLPYDNQILGDNMEGKPLRAMPWASATVPALVMDGGVSPVWLHHAAQAVAGKLPNAQHRPLEGQTHAIDPAVVAPLLIEFFEA